jgi:hypothetical protein
MHTEHLSVDDSSQSQKIKDLAAGFPYRRVAILLLTLLVEAVNLCNLPRLVVSADEGDSVRISGLISDTLESYCLVRTLP